MTTQIINKYNRKTPRIGVTGKQHLSEAEAKASFELFKYGIIPFEDMFKQTFFDVDGERFRACPDFRHEGTGVLFEFKTKKMNGKQSKARAKKAVENLEQQIAAGRIDESDRTFKLLEHAWNHSIQKVAAVSKQLPLHTPLVLVYECEHDLNEERRCKRNGVFMLSLKNLSGFAMFLKTASLGLAVGFKRNGFEFSASADSTTES